MTSPGSWASARGEGCRTWPGPPRRSPCRRGSAWCRRPRSSTCSPQRLRRAREAWRTSGCP
eukprot:1914370-Pyramimonas_sp.AAC.1